MSIGRLEKRTRPYLFLLSLLAASVGWAGFVVAAGTASPSPRYPHLASFLKTHPAVRILSFTDNHHEASFPIRSLERNLPALLEWGMTSLVVEMWDRASECLNQYVNLDPSLNPGLEEICDPNRFQGNAAGETVMALKYPNKPSRTPAAEKRLKAWHSILRTIQVWNWNQKRKVVIRPTDSALRAPRQILYPSKLQMRLPRIVPAPGSHEKNLSGQNLALYAERWLPLVLNHLSKRALAPAYEYLVTAAYRALEDQANFERYAFYRDPEEKIAVIYGAMHTVNYPLPGTYAGKPLVFLVKRAKEVLGSHRVLSLFTIGPNDAHTPPDFATDFEKQMASRPPGLYLSGDFGAYPLSALGMVTRIPTNFFELTQLELEERNAKPDAFDYFLVDETIVSEPLS
jgi:hypothetical protein